MPRLVVISIAVLLCIPAIALAQGDPAYVDSPAGRAVADPARADGGSVSVTSALPAPGALPTGMPNMTGIAQPQTQMELAALMAQQQQAQQATLGQPGAAQPSIPFGASSGAAYGAPQAGGMNQPGGYLLGAGYGTQPGYGGAPTGYGNAPSSAGPMQQIGGGLMQDAAGVLDARLHREIYGPNGPVVLAPPPGGVPGSDDTGW